MFGAFERLYASESIFMRSCDVKNEQRYWPMTSAESSFLYNQQMSTSGNINAGILFKESYILI